MDKLILAAADVVAMSVLVGLVFIPRFRRRDMAVTLVALNLGVMSVSMLLSSTEVNAGLGLGLFGLLSIVRLRSDEMTHEEMAFYFTALILGMIGGIPTTPLWLPLALMGALVSAVYLVGHPRFIPSQGRSIILDSALISEAAVRDLVGQAVSGEILSVRIRRVDLVNDSTHVDIRFRKDPMQRTPESHAPLPKIVMQEKPVSPAI